jgi:hypothetical protein
MDQNAIKQFFFFHFLICIWYKERSGTARNPKESETQVMGLLLSLFLILQVVVAVDAVAVEAELTIRETITVELNKRNTIEKLTTRPNFDHCFIFSLKFSFQINTIFLVYHYLKSIHL